MGKKYHYITTISTFRHTYAVPVDDCTYAEATAQIKADGVEEFTQEWVGEQIISSETMGEKKLLEVFDKENDYLSGWSKKDKVNRIRNWKRENDG